MEPRPARLYIPDPKTEIDAIRWRLDLIAVAADNFGPRRTNLLEKAIVKALRNELTSEDIKFWSEIANGEICEIDEVEYAILYFANQLFTSPEITEKQVIDLYPPAKNVVDAKKKIKKKSKKVERIILGGKFDLGVTKIYFRNIQLPIIRAKLALLELLAIIIPNDCIPKLVALTPHYLSGLYVRDWVSSQRYNRQFGDAKEKIIARNVLKKISRAIEGDARGNKVRNFGYWSLDCYCQWLSKSILKYRNALAKKNKHHRKILKKILDACPVPEDHRPLLAEISRKPKSLALEIMAAIKLIDDPKAFLNYQPKINRLKNKHQLDICLGPSGTIPLLEEYLDRPTRSPKLVFKQNLFSVLETL